jgi:hypothetical protein
LAGGRYDFLSNARREALWRWLHPDRRVKHPLIGRYLSGLRVARSEDCGKSDQTSCSSIHFFNSFQLLTLAISMSAVLAGSKGNALFAPFIGSTKPASSWARPVGARGSMNKLPYLTHTGPEGLRPLTKDFGS